MLITVRTTTPSSRKVADCRPSYWWPCLLGHRAHPRLFRFSFACRGVLSGSCYSASHHAVTVTVHESLRESIGFGNLVSAEGNLLILPNFRATGQHLKNNDHFSFLVLFLEQLRFFSVSSIFQLIWTSILFRLFPFNWKHGTHLE